MPVTIRSLLGKHTATTVTDTIKVQALASTVVIPYTNQDGHDETLMKMVVGDLTGTIPVMVNSARPDVYNMLQNAVSTSNTIKVYCPVIFQCKLFYKAYFPLHIYMLYSS